MRLKALAFGILLALAASSSAFAQCSGQPAAGRICANVGSAPALPGWATASAVLDRNFGGPSVQGTILNRGASLWSATASPVLGLNGAAGGSLQLMGSSTGSATISVAAAAGSVTFRLPINNGTPNQVLSTDGSGNLFYATLSGSGTVTSVGLSMPAIFSVSGSPVTGTGTLTATLANQSANLVWAGPTTGAAAAPTFRSLVGADLPNPSASTLGGVQSFAAVTSQWIRQISTAGIPSASQPAFTDISGTLSAAQCPSPGASSLGCVQSFAAVASQWLRQISTSGVVTASQPSFSDISGNLTLPQLPSISNLSVLGNNSGGTAIPSALSASQVLDMIGPTRGQILFRGAAGWQVLSPGTSGFVLSTNGPGADPSYISVSGTGTVQQIIQSTGITVTPASPCTANCTIALTTIGAGTVLSNVTGGTAAPVPNTPSAILDVIGSGTGSVLYRAAGGTGWQALAAGTNGQVLTMGASTPAWANAGSVTNVTITAGNGIATSGTCNISSTGTCTIQTSITSSTTTGASTTYTGSQCGSTVLRSNAGSPMIDTIPGTGAGVLAARCVVTIFNNDTAGLLAMKVAAGATIKAALSFTGYIYICPGQAFTFFSDGSNYFTTAQPDTCVLQANTTFFAAASGGASTNHGLTAAAPLDTMTNAYNLARQVVTTNPTLVVKIKAAAGTWTNIPQIFDGPIPGQPGTDTQSSVFPVIIEGDTTTPANVQLAQAATGVGTCCDGITVANGASLLVQGFQIFSSHGNDIIANNAKMAYRFITFQGAAINHMAATHRAFVEVAGNYTIAGDASGHWLVSDGASIYIQVAATITLSGNHSYNVATGQYSGSNIIFNATPTWATGGFTVTGLKCAMTLNSVLSGLALITPATGSGPSGGGQCT